MSNELEIRQIEAKDISVHERKLSGYAIVFNSLSHNLGGFRERVLPTALDATLASGREIKAYAQHDRKQPIGRTSKGTLRLFKDEIGLRFEIDVPPTTVGNDLLVNISPERQDIDGMSFGFLTSPIKDRFIRENGETIRELVEIELDHISPVTNPAYPATKVSARAIEQAKETETPTEPQQEKDEQPPVNLNWKAELQQKAAEIGISF